LRLGVAANAVRSEFKKLAGGATLRPEQFPAEEAEAVEFKPPSAHEYWLLKLLLLHDDLVDWAAAHLELAWIQHSLVRQIVAQRLEAHQNSSWNSLAEFLDNCSSPEMQNLITEAVAERRPVPNPAQQLADVAAWLRKQFIEQEMADLMQRVNQPGVSDGERLDLLRRQQELRTLKRMPMHPLAGSSEQK